MLRIPVVILGVSTAYINDPSVSYLIATSQAHHRKVLAPLRNQFIRLTAFEQGAHAKLSEMGSHKVDAEMAQIRVRNLISIISQSAKSSGSLDDIVRECMYEFVGMLLRSNEVESALGQKNVVVGEDPVAVLKQILDPIKYRQVKREVATAGRYALEVGLGALDEISELSLRAERCLKHFDNDEDHKRMVMDYLAAFMRAMVSVFICLFVLDGTLVKLKRVLQQQVPRYTVNAAHGLLGRLTALEDAIEKAENSNAKTRKAISLPSSVRNVPTVAICRS